MKDLVQRRMRRDDTTQPTETKRRTVVAPHESVLSAITACAAWALSHSWRVEFPFLRKGRRHRSAQSIAVHERSDE
eukprot:2895669-Amphidinium_carterae.1